MSINRWVRLLIALSLSAICILIGAGVANRNAQTAKQERFKLEFDGGTGAEETGNPKGVSEFHPAETPATNKRSEQEILIVADWFKRVGYSTELEKNYGEQYTDDQLRELVQKGDVIAIDVLSNRLRTRDSTQFMDELMRLRNANDIEGIGKLLDSRNKEGKQEYELLWERGIAYGSYNSISAMSHRYKPYFNIDDSPEEKQYNSRKLKDYLSYVRLLELRGVKQLYGGDTAERLLLENYRSIYNSELTAADWDEIAKYAQALYDHFQTERYKLGLGDFNNQLPDEVKKFLDE